MPILNIKNLIHKYMTYDDSEKNQEIRAIDDVSFSVEKGEFIAILEETVLAKSFSCEAYQRTAPADGRSWSM